VKEVGGLCSSHRIQKVRITMRLSEEHGEAIRNHIKVSCQLDSTITFSEVRHFPSYQLQIFSVFNKYPLLKHY
jgi:hypothetical protein